MIDSTKLIFLAIGFVAGAGTGVAGSFGYFKKKFSKKMNEELSKMEERYRVPVKYTRVKFDEDEKSAEDDFESREKNYILSADRRAEIKQKLIKGRQQTTNYAEMYKMKNEDQEEESDDVEIDPGQEFDKFYQKNKDKPPKIISLEDAIELPEFINQQALLYYTENDVLLDEESNEIIEDRQNFIGNTLEKYDFRNNDDDRMYVLNWRLTTCYEIQKMDDEYIAD